MLLVEMAEAVLGRRRSAVLMATGAALGLGAAAVVGVTLPLLPLTAVVLHRSWASVDVGWPAVLAARRFFLHNVLIAILIKYPHRALHDAIGEGAAAPAPTARSAAFLSGTRCPARE